MKKKEKKKVVVKFNFITDPCGSMCECMLCQTTSGHESGPIQAVDVPLFG